MVSSGHAVELDSAFLTLRFPPQVTEVLSPNTPDLDRPNATNGTDGSTVLKGKAHGVGWIPNQWMVWLLVLFKQSPSRKDPRKDFVFGHGRNKRFLSSVCS